MRIFSTEKRTGNHRSFCFFKIERVFTNGIILWYNVHCRLIGVIRFWSVLKKEFVTWRRFRAKKADFRTIFNQFIIEVFNDFPVYNSHIRYYKSMKT